MLSGDMAGISFSLKRRRVLIHRSTLRSLGEPTNIRFLLNMKMKKVAVQACEAIDRDSFVVPDFKEVAEGHFEISSINFLNVVYKLGGWDINKTYRIAGEEFCRNRLVEFELDEAAIITDEEFEGEG